MIKNIKESPVNLAKKRTRVIRMIRSQKLKTYFFEEKIVLSEQINIFFKRKSK